MPIDCNNPPCGRVLPASTIISVFGDSTTPANTDCSTNLLYLTDEAGLVNQADGTSGEYLTTDSRTRQLSSAQEVDLHFSKCSRTSYELSSYFSWPTGDMKRPKMITVAYFDSANESMLEALQSIYECYTCFYTVTHVAEDINGNAIYDTDAQLELAEWGTAYSTRVVLPTASDLVIDGSDSTSNAAVSKSEGHTEAVYQYLNDECIPELDANCEETGATANVYGVQHLVMAGVISSLSSESSSYQFNVKFKPLGAGILNAVSTAQLTQAETFVATGSNPSLDGIQTLSPHHVNVYHNVGGSRFLLEGLTATGDYIDDRVHRRYIEDMLNTNLMDLLVNQNVVSIADISSITARLTLTIRSLISKGIITDTAGSIDLDEFENIFLSGNGYVLTKEDTTQDNLDSRITPRLTFCYVRPGGVNYISIGLCESQLGDIN